MSQDRAAHLASRSRLRRWLGWSVPAVVAGVATWMLVARPLAPARNPGLAKPPKPPAIGVEGKGGLLVYTHDGAGNSQMLVDGAVVSAGTSIKSSVRRAKGHDHVLVVSVDAAGAVTVFHPYGADASAPVNGPNPVALPGSIELDGTLGPERLFLFTASQPFRAAPVLAALEALAARGARAVEQTETVRIDGLTQDSVLLEKVRDR